MGNLKKAIFREAERENRSVNGWLLKVISDKLAENEQTKTTQ